MKILSHDNACLPQGSSSDNNLPMDLYPFSLEFNSDKNGKPHFASFPFIMDSVRIAGISCGISSRFSGNMRYAEQNQARLDLFSALGLGPARVYGLKQIHSHTVLKVDRQNPPVLQADPELRTVEPEVRGSPPQADPESPLKADGMVSNDRSISLSVTVADCLPVYLLDCESGAFGLVHSGWKGTGIVLEALRLMGENWGTRPEAVAAVLGPCIDVCCYKVDAERAEVFKNQFGAECIRKSSEGNFSLDLKTANIRLLSGAGVRNIAVCNECTFTDERLGSFRREGSQNYTLMAALVFFPVKNHRV